MPESPTMIAQPRADTMTTVEERGFAASAAPQDDKELALVDVKAYAVQCPDFARAKAIYLDQVRDAKLCLSFSLHVYPFTFSTTIGLSA